MASELILVGASVRGAAQSALRAGFRAYAIDQFADRDLSAICPAVKVCRYPQDFLPALVEAPQAPWIYTGGLENFPRLVDRLAQLRPLWGNPGEVLKGVRDPWKLSAAVRESGLEMPPMARELRGRAERGCWLLKPRRSSGGHRVELARGAAQQKRRGHYYQLFVPGQAHGAVYLASNTDCQLLGISRQIQDCGTFRYQGSIVAPGPRHRSAAALERLGQTLTDRFSLRGLFNVDFIASDAGDWPLEVNPRYSASVELLERAGGISLLAMHAAVFQQRDFSAPTIPVSRLAVGKAVVYAPTDGAVTAGIDELVAQWNAGADWPSIADVPSAGDAIGAGQPICTVFAEGATVEIVERQLEARVQRVLESALADASRS